MAIKSVKRGKCLLNGKPNRGAMRREAHGVWATILESVWQWWCDAPIRPARNGTNRTNYENELQTSMNNNGGRSQKKGNNVVYKYLFRIFFFGLLRSTLGEVGLFSQSDRHTTGTEVGPG